MLNSEKVEDNPKNVPEVVVTEDTDNFSPLEVA